MTIDALPTPPNSSNPVGFAAAMDTFLAALPTFRTQANALALAMTAVAAGGAVSLQYTFSTTTTDSDPGTGIIRLDNATQNTATTIRADLVGSDGSTLTGILDLLDDSTSTNKGYLTLRHATTPTKWIVFSVTALASPSGYRNIAVTPVASSTANPFIDTDPLLFDFTPTGDKGATGAAGSGITPQAVGFTVTGGTTPKTLTVALDASVAGTNTGDQSAANPTGTISGSAVNGSASTFMRSDAAPAISMTIAQFNAACTDADFMTTAAGATTGKAIALAMVFGG